MSFQLCSTAYFFILDFQQNKGNQIFPLQPSTPTFHYIIALVLHLYSAHERWNSFKRHLKNGSFLNLEKHTILQKYSCANHRIQHTSSEFSLNSLNFQWYLVLRTTKFKEERNLVLDYFVGIGTSRRNHLHRS